MNNLLYFLTTVIIWGSTWVAIKFQVANVTPEISVAFRFFLASLIFFIWCKIKNLSLKFNIQTHKWFFLIGILMFCLNYLGLYFAQKYISSALNSIIFSTMVLMNIINARLFFNTRIHDRVYLGAVFGVLGIILIFVESINLQQLSPNTLVGILAAFVGTLFASFATIASQKAQSKNIPILQSNAWGMLYRSILTMLIALLKGQSFIIEWSNEFTLSLLYLSVFGCIGFYCYMKLIGNIGSEKAGYVVVASLVAAIHVAISFEGFIMTQTIAIGIGMTILGNLLVMVKKTD